MSLNSFERTLRSIAKMEMRLETRKTNLRDDFIRKAQRLISTFAIRKGELHFSREVRRSKRISRDKSAAAKP